jgi:lysophospholipid acyltransferase (LPLAT)-like uncharacterized protein
MAIIKKFKHLYTVDKVPLLLKPFYYLFSYSFAYSHYCWNLLVHYTSRIKIEYDNITDLKQKSIFMIWHSEIFAYFTAINHQPDLALINHPLWYMKPIHVFLKLFGVKKIFLGSSGHGGRQAAENLAKALSSKNYSTFINPDGPDGPYHKIKKGVFHLAKQTGLPIIPVRVHSKPAIHLSGWDRKVLSLPFSKMRVRYGKPIYINENSDFEAAAHELKHAMDILE